MAQASLPVFHKLKTFMDTLIEDKIHLPGYPANLDKAVGITTTVPIEIIFAAGYIPIDLNNVFISDDDPYGMVDDAELNGLPRNTCAWTKGVYAAAVKTGVKKIVGVVQGDCSHTHALMDIFESEGFEVVPFEYPYKRDKNRLEEYLKSFAHKFGADFNKIDKMKKALDRIRANVHEIDRLAWQENRVNGEENHIWNVSTSDMAGDYESYEKRAVEFLNKAKSRQPIDHKLRIGYIGIPPICDDLYSFLAELRCHVVFNESQRQFSMPFTTDSLAEQYTLYTYPYDVFAKLEDIEREIERRKIDGVISYVQNFCHRPIYEKIIRNRLKVPILSLDFDKPGSLNGAMRTRIEAFSEMLKKR